MKQVFITMVIIATTITVSGQTPADIAAKWKEIQHCCEKYDNGADSAYRMLNEQIAATRQDPVANAIWHSCLAQFLSDYYNGNRYRISQRTEIASETPADFKEWDARTFQRRAREEYLLSLNYTEQLPQESAKEYVVLLQKFRDALQVKTLYEVLAYRALDYFTEQSEDMSDAEKPIPSDALWNNDQFLDLSLPVTDTSSTMQIILSIYQDLTRHHIALHQEMDLNMLTLERYDWMRKHGLAPDNSIDWYIEFLEQWAAKSEQMRGYGLIACKIGEQYLNRYRQNADASDVFPENVPQDDLIKADSWLKIALNASGKSFYNSANRTLKQIHTRTLNISSVSGGKCVFSTKSPSLWQVKYANAKQMHVKVVTASPASLDVKQEKVYEYVISQKAVYEEAVSLADKGDFMTHSGYYMLPELPAGAYWLLVSDQAYPDWDAETPREYIFFQISDIDVHTRKVESGLEVLVVNRESGEPLRNARVTTDWYGKRTSRTTDANGFCLFEVEKNSKSGGTRDRLMVDWQGQSLITESNYWWWYSSSEEKERVIGHLFTDRTLYRPGQTVHFKVLFEKTQLDEKGNSAYSKLLTNVNVKVKFRDANYQLVDELELATNEFGSAASELYIPERGLTGSYQIEAIAEQYSISQRISVEEYKLPAFEVKVEEPEETFSIGQEVTVEGSAMALAGYPLGGASVSYRVTRTVSYPWWRGWWYPNAQTQGTIAHGTLQTDDEGKFKVTFPTAEDKSLRDYIPLYRYQVSVDVTDINGETHSGSAVVYVSSRNLLLICDIKDEYNLEKDHNQFEISLTNTARKPQSGTVHYEIFKLEPPKQYLFNRTKADVVITSDKQLRQQFPQYAWDGENNQENWPAVSIRKGSMEVKKEEAAYFVFPDWFSLSEGYYKVVFYTIDKNGNRIETECYTHLYRASDPKCSAYKSMWAVVDRSVNVGDNLKVLVGSRLPESHVFCEIFAHGEKVYAQWLTLNGNTQTVVYPVTKRDLGNIRVYLKSEYSSRNDDRTYDVSVVDSMKDIRFEFLRFRDKTLPGSQEEYQIRLVDKTGKPVSAELLCSMYDYALDALGGSNDHGFRFFVPNYGYDCTFSNPSWGKKFDQYNYRDIYLYYHTDLIKDWLAFGTYGCTGSFRRYGKTMTVRGNRSDGAQTIVDGVRVRPSNANAVQELAVEFDEVEMVEEVAEEEPPMFFAEEVAPTAPPKRAKSAGGESKPAVQLRTNFNETAFFYPQLRTDETGNVYISFTMPDALTKWKMQGVAHNPDLMYGFFEKAVQTRKEVMIVPNAPRFLREGDTIDFSAKLVNTSDKHLCGHVTLEMFDATNNKPVAMICDEGTNNGIGRDAKFCVSTTTGNAQYDVEPGASQEAHFRIVVPTDLPAVTYRIIAHNTDPTDIAGDGEEKTLPVLTNRMMVTESMPFYISGKGSKTFTFTKLQNSFGATDGRDVARNVSTLKHFRLTVECTPNPVWYAIQAMPYMMEYPYECNEQMFSRYYANTLATSIIKANPVIEEVFNRWQTESPDAFCSALEKNQELKQVVLEETPWVLDAQREGADKQRVAMLFDFKRMAKEEAATLKKLQKGQNGDGGWPWFAGGKSSDFITRHIVAGFGHLKALGVSTDMAKSSLHQAVSYIDEQMYKRYLDRKKYNIDYVNETHYLYARSFYRDQLAGKYKAAYDTCYKAMIGSWAGASFYTQAMIALTAWRSGDQKVARKIVKNLKNLAQHDEEMGMFWKKQGGGWFWYEQPVERQAMLIEAFHTITPEDAESLAQMQLWLLKQKQTQHWGTTKSTTEAIYALLLNQKLTAGTENVTLTVGNVTLSDKEMQTEAGTGYFKKAWSGEDITPDKANVRIEKGTDGPAWGGLYWQYFENLDKITRSDDKNLIIEKQLFKVVNTDKGEVLQPITEGSPFSVGDKVRVRVVITCDRDMEYVHLKDQRAAAFEPVNVFSQYKYQDGLWYYEATKDATTHFFIDWMRKGKYVFEYTLFATQSGNFSNGITEIECMYAPEFRSHSAGVRVKVQ